MSQREKNFFTMHNTSAGGTDAWWDRFQALLDDQNEWPSTYTFKFIVPKTSLAEMKAIFGDHEIDVKASSKGNYHSVTARVEMPSSEAVRAVYDAAGRVDGVISL